MALKILVTPSFSRVVKKLHAKDKKEVDAAIVEIATDPTIGDEKKGDLIGIFVYKFKLNKQEVLLAYRLQPSKFKPQEIVLLSLGSHENFYSNINGYLAELNVAEGEYVSTGTALFKIASLETVWVNAEVYQNELSSLFQNPEIELEFEALPNEIFKGQIILNPPVLDANKKVSSVKISVQNTKGKIQPGMMAVVSVSRNQKNTLVILKSSIVLGKGSSSVWIQTSSGMFEKRMIETGIENKVEIEVISGISEGDLIVSSGSYLLNSVFILKNGANSMGGMKM